MKLSMPSLANKLDKITKSKGVSNKKPPISKLDRAIFPQDLFTAFNLPAAKQQKSFLQSVYVKKVKK